MIVSSSSNNYKCHIEPEVGCDRYCNKLFSWDNNQEEIIPPVERNFQCLIYPCCEDRLAKQTTKNKKEYLNQGIQQSRPRWILRVKNFHNPCLEGF